MRIRAACYGLPTIKILTSIRNHQMSNKTTSVKLGQVLDDWVEEYSIKADITASEFIRSILEERRTGKPIPQAIIVQTSAGEEYIATGSKLAWESSKFGKRVRELTSKLVSSPEETVRKEGRAVLTEARFLANEFQRAGKVWGTLTPELYKKIRWAYEQLVRVAKMQKGNETAKADLQQIADVLGYIFLGKPIPDYSVASKVLETKPDVKGEESEAVTKNV
jgi:hypothetical protein